MHQRVLDLFNYGLYVVSSRFDGKDNACIANSVFQVTNAPPRIAVCLSKTSLTHEMIAKTHMFNVSILNRDATQDLIKHFGFFSGRNSRKFEDAYEDEDLFPFTENGIRALKLASSGYISARVVQTVDLDTHDIFIGEITDSRLYVDSYTKRPITYRYYRDYIKL